MTVLAIDPGPAQSAIVEWDGQKLHAHCIEDNERLLWIVQRSGADALVIEQVASYGMPVGQEIFATVHWAGRFHQAWLDGGGGPVHLVPRLDVKMHLCHQARAKDSNLWQVLVDRFGPPGTKAAPGLLHGITSHQRAALALAVMWFDQNKGEE